MVVVLTVKVAVEAAAGTLTDAGVEREVLVSERVTIAPPVGAAVDSVTVQVLEALGPRLEGLQARADTVIGATRVTVVCAELLLYEAEMVAVWLLGMVLVETVKVAAVAAAATVTEVGTVNVELLFVSVIAAPAVGAAAESVTVQVELLEPLMLLGLHETELTFGRALPVTVPPVVERETALPFGREATPLATPIAVELAPAARVRFRVATVPFAMMAEFKAYTTHVTVPVPLLHVRDLPAAVAAEPMTGAKDVTLAAA
jgi:hypothetical protein